MSPPDLEIPSGFWIPVDKEESRPCVVLERFPGPPPFYLTAKGTTKLHRERGRVHTIAKTAQPGKDLDLKGTTYFDPWSFTTLLVERQFQPLPGLNVTPRTADVLLQLFFEAAQKGQLRRDDPKLMTAYNLLTAPQPPAAPEQAASANAVSAAAPEANEEPVGEPPQG